MNYKLDEWVLVLVLIELIEILNDLNDNTIATVNSKLYDLVSLIF